MNSDMLRRLFESYEKEVPPDIAPMTISWLGNSSVATVPTLLDLAMRGNLPGHRLNAGDNLVFASVGAGLHTDSMVYRMPG